jgi:ubiquinone/menaquinone biosynthesis C-methylase UbiE
VHFESFDVAHLPYADQSFDVAVSTISMHHWAELEQPLRELYRILRPGDGFGSMTSALSNHRRWRRRKLSRPLLKPRSRMGLCEREEARSLSTGVLPCRRRISTKTNPAREGS